jgi:NADH-ubiquinone oxidoreductase chain 5
MWYMKEDPHIIRFILYMNVFKNMMILLVLSNNILIMLVGWEGVGLISYLLINFWYTRIAANKAAFKAIIFNKVGDIFFIFSIILLIIYYYLFDTFDNSLIINSYINSLIIIGFIIATIAKSAQIGLHNWLGDAMEGPTPVSALLHAATMVTAGIFLIYRVLPLFILNIYIYEILAIIGILTILIGGTLSLFQNDIKKIIAFSTCSQLGYMLYSNSIGIFNSSYLHLIIHGYFKALLFLTAGLLIHSFNNHQDIRKFGGFIFFTPISYIYFLIGTLSIISWPFFSGFYSKDFILESSFFSNSFIYLLSIIGVFITISYSFRLYTLIFMFKPKLKITQIKEPKFYLFIILFFGSLFLGFFLKDFFSIHSFNISFLPFFSLDVEFIPLLIKLLPIFITLIGIIFGILLEYLINIIKISYIINYLFYIYNFNNKKLFIDAIYTYYLYNKTFINSYKIFIKIIDKGLFEIFCTLGIFRFSLSHLSYSPYNNYSYYNIVNNSYLFIFFFLILFLFLLQVWLF